MKIINFALQHIYWGNLIMDLNGDHEYELELEEAKNEYLIAADFLKG